MITAGFAFLLIIVGALASGTGGAASEWPFSFDSLLSIGHLSGGAAYALAHRLVALILVLLTVALFLWVLFGERRGWVKWVAALAVVSLALQIAIGRLHTPVGAPTIAVLHVFFAQLFLGVLVSLTVFTSPGWVRAGQLRAGFAKAPKPLVFFIATAASVVLLIQVLLGTAYRQDLVGLPPHIAGGLVAGGLVFWAASLVVRLDLERDRAFPYLMRPARVGVWLYVFQLAVGVLTYLWTRSSNAYQVQERAVITSAVHSGLSAALVATEVMLLIRLYRMVPIMEQPA